MTFRHNTPIPQIWRGRFAKNTWHPLRHWFAIGALLLLFVALAEDVVEREPMHFDTPLLLWLHSHATPLFDRFMLLLTWLGGTALLTISGIMLLGFLWWGKRQWVLFWASALGGASLLNVGAKIVFQRARPDLWISLSPEHDYGFPSGHSMVSSAFVMTLLLLVWRSQIAPAVKWTVTGLGIFFALGVGLSRLYLGVHYPSDVIAGWALSAAWILLLQKAFQLSGAHIKRTASTTR